MKDEEVVAGVLANLTASPVAAASSTETTKSPEEQDGANKSVDAKKAPRKRTKKPCHVYPVAPMVIQMIKKPREYIDHSYRDFSKVPPELKDDQQDLKIEDMSFSQKVHDILSQPGKYGKWISWLPHGRAFHVHFPLWFEKNVCEKYFGHKRYSSFLRQLNNHGFKHITKGPDRNSYYHECFLRDMPHLCKYMPPAKDARRLIPDPDSEPDFNAISRVYPVPGGSTTPKAPTETPQTPSVAAVAPTTATSLPPMAAQKRPADPMWAAQHPPAKRISVMSSLVADQQKLLAEQKLLAGLVPLQEQQERLDLQRQQQLSILLNGGVGRDALLAHRLQSPAVEQLQLQQLLRQQRQNGPAPSSLEAWLLQQRLQGRLP